MQRRSFGSLSKRGKFFTVLGFLAALSVIWGVISAESTSITYTNSLEGGSTSNLNTVSTTSSQSSGANSVPGVSGDSSSSPDTNTSANTIPSAPTNLSLYAALSSKSKVIPLKWTDNSDNETIFKIERKPSNENTFAVISRKDSNSNFYSDSGSITPGRLYDYRVAACAGDLCSEYVYLQNVFIPLPESTTNTTTTTTTTTNTSTTNTSDTGTTDSNEPGTTTVPPKTEVSPTTTTPPPVTANTDNTPSAPTNLVLYTTLSSASLGIPLKWTDNSTNETGFRLERKPSTGGAFSFVAKVVSTAGASTASYIDTNSIVPGRHYDYRVAACVGDLCSNYTYLVEVFIPVPVPKDDSSDTVPPKNPALPPSTSTTDSGEPHNPIPKPNPASSTDSTDNIPKPPHPTHDTNHETVDSSETNAGHDNDAGETASLSPKKPDFHPEDWREEGKDLIFKDTNKDGVSDYDSIYIYKIDPEKPSPVSEYEGKKINASEKILLGFDPTKSELVKPTPESPKESIAPVLPDYKVDHVSVSDKKEVVLKGQALPNSFVTIYIYSTPIIVTVKTNNLGEWEYVMDKELEDGNHSVYVAKVNNTGNIVAKSSEFVFIKTAEAATLRDTPTTVNTSTRQPGLLEGSNMFVVILVAIAGVAMVLILVGVSYRKSKEKMDMNS